MKVDLKARFRGLQATLSLPREQILLLFGVEGILYQFSQSVNNFGNKASQWWSGVKSLF